MSSIISSIGETWPAQKIRQYYLRNIQRRNDTSKNGQSDQQNKDNERSQIKRFSFSNLVHSSSLGDFQKNKY